MVAAGGGTFLTLRAGTLSLTLAPEVGGSIARFEYERDGGRIPILRGCQDGSDDVLAMGSFPLVPYVNRIRGGQFRFRDRHVTIDPNMAGDPSPLHGQGWLSPWRVEETSEADAVLSFEHAGGEWPWTYVAEQRFRLTADGLDVSLSCTNRSGEPMPCGLGQHPYLHCGPSTRLETQVSHVWLIDEHVLPTEKVPAENRYDLSDVPVCGMGLDHGFGGWGGSARVSDPQWPFRVVMSSTDAEFFQLYSPPEGGMFVIEPVTHANAALNAPEEEWAELGMKILEPGQTMSLQMRLEVTSE